MRKGNGEGSIYQRKSDRRWVAAITLGYDAHGRRQRRTAIAASKVEARQKLQELQREATQGLNLDRDPSLGSYLRKWLKESAPRTLRPRTLAGYASIIERHLIPALGRIPLRRLQPGDVEAYLNGVIEKRLTPRTAQYHHAVLRRALGQAERWGLLSRNPARLVTAPRPQRREVRPLTLQEARHFLDGVQDDRLAALYTVAVYLGLRQSELLALRWQDIDLDDLDAPTAMIVHSLQRYGGAYHLDEVKSLRSRRTITLPPAVVDALRAHRARQNSERLQAGPIWQQEWNLVFSNEIGEPLDGTALTRAFQQRLAEIGLPRQRFHDLRHLSATVLIAQKVPLRAVMEILGHSTIAVTADTYGHVSRELQADAMDRMQAALSG